MKYRKLALLFLASSFLAFMLVLAFALSESMPQHGKISIARTSQTPAETNCEDKNNGCYNEHPRLFVNPYPPLSSHHQQL
jgi:hypothetical protein